MSRAGDEYGDPDEPMIDHGFGSPTAIVAYCGAVERVSKPREATDPYAPNACPECRAVWLRIAAR